MCKGYLVIEAIKQIYPDIGGGFTYWETNPDGSEWSKPYDGLVWENPNFKKPTWKQIEKQFDALHLKELKNQKIKICQDYIEETDFYIIRMSDPTSKKPIPEEVISNRSKARELKEKIKSSQTVEELNAIEIVWQTKQSS